jgi:hypothetical protein
MSAAIIGQFRKTCIAMCLNSEKYFRKGNVIASRNVLFLADLLFSLHPKTFQPKVFMQFWSKWLTIFCRMTNYIPWIRVILEKRIAVLHVKKSVNSMEPEFVITVLSRRRHWTLH